MTADTWINRLYAQRSHARGSRWLAFSRIGASIQEGWDGLGSAQGAAAFAEHTQSIHFTGDTCGPAPMLSATAAFTAAESAIGMSYVSHDIGAFHGDNTRPCELGQFLPIPLHHSPHLPDDLYVRWVQLGTFQPLNRLHSQHGERLPWQYPGQAEQIASDFLRLRESLIPYLYTVARIAHDTGVTMVRPLYLEWPDHDAAYEHPAEFMLGDNMLVGTVDQLGERASVSLWVPPGIWYDFFTGEALAGPATVQREVPLNQYPVFVRAGSILPRQAEQAFTSAGPQGGLELHIWPGDGHFSLYDDAGRGLEYLQGGHTQTSIHTSTTAAGCQSLTIAKTQGRFQGALNERRWTAGFHQVQAPANVRLNGQAIANSAAGSTIGWSYDASTLTLSVTTGPQPTNADVNIQIGGPQC